MVERVACWTKRDEIARFVPAAGTYFPQIMHVQREDASASGHCAPISRFRKNDRNDIERQLRPLSRFIVLRIHSYEAQRLNSPALRGFIALRPVE